MTFPTDAYTPYGYLHSPEHVARSWNDASGGMIRTSERFLGMGWAYVHPRRAVFLCAGLELGKTKLHSRADWAACGLHATHHSSQLMTFRASPPGCTLTLSYFRLRTGVLAAHASLHAETEIAGRWGWLLDADRVPGHWKVMDDRAVLTGREPHTLLVRDGHGRAPASPPAPRRVGSRCICDAGEVWEGWALLANTVAPTDPRLWWHAVAAVEEEKRRDDDALLEPCAPPDRRLAGALAARLGLRHGDDAPPHPAAGRQSSAASGRPGWPPGRAPSSPRARSISTASASRTRRARRTPC